MFGLLLMISCSEWNIVNLLRERFSFRSWGRVPSAMKRRAGSTRVESEAKLLAERFSSSRVWKKDRSEGRVHSPF